MQTPAKKLTLFFQRNIAGLNSAPGEAIIAEAFDDFRATLNHNCTTALNTRRITKNLRFLSLTLLNLIYLLDENINDSAAGARLRSMLLDLYQEVNEAKATCLPGTNKMLVPLPFSELVSNLSEINIYLNANAGNTAVYQILKPHITGLNAGTKLTFYRWLWWQNFYRHALMVQHENNAADDMLMEMFIQLNFNTPQFVALLLKHIKNDINTAGSLDCKQAVLHDYIIKYRCLENDMPGFYVAAPALKKIMLRSLKLQLHAMHASDYSFNDRNTQATSSGMQKLVTNLPVAQLAVLLRLLLDEGIINTSNQSDVFRLVAMYMQTTRTQSISSDSLRNKFYSPDNAAKTIIKDHLLNMFNHLKQY